MLAAIDKAVISDPKLKSRHTITQYRSNLHDFVQWLDGRALTKTLVEEYAAELQKALYAPATINQRLASIRWWARKALDVAEDLLPDTPDNRKRIKQAARVLAVEDVKGKRLPRGRYLSQAEQSELIAACGPGPAGTRNAAMIAVALSVGLRRDDLTTLQMENIKKITPESCDLVVHGKGDNVEELYLYNDYCGGFQLLSDWLALRGQDPGPVFCQIRKNGKIVPSGRLSGTALRKILDHVQIGTSLPEHITWHDFRKTFICRQLDEGNDLSVVQKNARHASPNTTGNIYDIRGQRARRAAMRTKGETHAS
jgi:integrase